MDRVKRIWYLSPMWAAKVQASLRIRTVSPEPSLLAHTSSESRGTFRQKARSLAPLNGWACAVEICHDGMLEDTNSLDGAQVIKVLCTSICLLLRLRVYIRKYKQSICTCIGHIKMNRCKAVLLIWFRNVILTYTKFHINLAFTLCTE